MTFNDCLGKQIKKGDLVTFTIMKNTPHWTSGRVLGGHVIGFTPKKVKIQPIDGSGQVVRDSCKLTIAVEAPEEIDRVCDDCGKPIIKEGNPSGRFEGCRTVWNQQDPKRGFCPGYWEFHPIK